MWIVYAYENRSEKPLSGAGTNYLVGINKLENTRTLARVETLFWESIVTVRTVLLYMIIETTEAKPKANFCLPFATGFSHFLGDQ